MPIIIDPGPGGTLGGGTSGGSTGGTRLAADFIPTSDADFVAWSTNFLTVLNANLTALGLVAGDVTPISTAETAFATSYTAQVTAQAAADSAVATKRTRRTTYETALRPFVRRIQAAPGMTDGIRAQLGVTVPKGTRTRRGVGTEIPGMALELRPGEVIIHFGTNAGNEQQNGKPAWALGCNIYRKKGAETEYTLIAFDTASPYTDHVTGPAVNVSYKAAYRGVRAPDEGGLSPEQTVAAGG